MQQTWPSILCLKEAMAALRSLLCALAVMLVGGPASALDLQGLFGPNMPNDFYAGVGLNKTHHTGYVPGTRFHPEVWVPGAKVFGGWRIFDRARLETAYHYLGTSTFEEGFPGLRTSERSHAVSETLLLYTPPVQELTGLPTFIPLRVFGRVGGAYKFIHQQSVFGNFDESGVSYHLGFGLEWELSPVAFARIEYEYISKIVTGTDRVVDVQHTPISAVFGVRF
jgi:opacity protein-like surface antigen